MLEEETGPPPKQGKPSLCLSHSSLPSYAEPVQTKKKKNPQKWVQDSLAKNVIILIS